MKRNGTSLLPQLGQTWLWPNHCQASYDTESTTITHDLLSDIHPIGDAFVIYGPTTGYSGLSRSTLAADQCHPVTGADGFRKVLENR